MSERDKGVPSGAPDPDQIPEQLRALDQWVVWKYEKVEGRDKLSKVLKQTSGANASSTNPATWTTFPDALAAAGRFDGVGFVFSETDPYVGVDLDACLEAGELHPAAARIVDMFSSYTERSPSRTGLHIIVRADLNGHPRNRTGDVPWGGKAGQIEVYSSGRYFTMTGNRLEDTSDAVEQRQSSWTGS